MAKVYNKNYALEIARAKIFNGLKSNVQLKLFDVLELSSGDYLPKSKMSHGSFAVYGGGGLTESTHESYNIEKRTIGIGRVGARCGCVFIIKEMSWVTDNALYVSKFKRDYDLSFLRHYLNFQDLNQYANQSAQPVVSQKGISKCTIPDIEKNEQVKIGKTLDAIEHGKVFEDIYGLKAALEFERDISKLKLEIEHQQSYLTLLRQTILQEAVQGKLTPQVETDEPAAELLKRIKAEKQKLVKEGKLKKEKELPPIREEEIPFELPKGWVWCRLGEICYLITDGTHHTPKYLDTGVPFISVKDISKGVIDFSETKFISAKEHSDLIKRCNPEFGDILLTKVGTTGIAKVVDVKTPFSIFVSIALLKFNQELIFNYYLESLINSPFVKKQSKEGTEGIGNKNLVLRKIHNFLIPLPPQSEQRRIILKVQQFIQHLNQLEQQVVKSQKQAQQLLQAVLKEAFERRITKYVVGEELALAGEA